MRRGLDLFTCGHRTRSCDLNQALVRVTAAAGVALLHLGAKRDGTCLASVQPGAFEEDGSSGKLLGVPSSIRWGWMASPS